MGKLVAVFVAMLASACFMWQSVNSQLCISYNYKEPTTFDQNTITGTTGTKWIAVNSTDSTGKVTCHEMTMTTKSPTSMKVSAKLTAAINGKSTPGCYNIDPFTRLTSVTNNVTYNGTAVVKTSFLGSCSVNAGSKNLAATVLVVGCNCCIAELNATTIGTTIQSFTNDTALVNGKTDCQKKWEQMGGAQMYKIQGCS